MKLILNGGGGKEKIADSVELFVSLLGNDKKVMYIPLAWNHGDPADCIDWFADLVGDFGVRKENIVLITDAKQITKSALKQVSGVFIGGGNTFKLLKQLKSCSAFENLNEFIQNDGLIMGGSAGALIFGESIDTCLDDGLEIKSICDKNEVGLLDTSGFDALNGYSILPHYLVKSEQAEKTKIRLQRLLNEGYKLICLPEESSVFVHDSKLDFIGPTKPTILSQKENLKQ